MLISGSYNFKYVEVDSLNYYMEKQVTVGALILILNMQVAKFVWQ